MTHQILRAEFLKLLTHRLESYGFAYKQRLHRYIKEEGEITQIFQVIFLNDPDGFRVFADAGIRIESVENVFHRTSGFVGKRLQNDTATLGASLGSIADTGNKLQFDLKSEGDVVSASTDMLDAFEQIALPVFRQFASLEAVDEVVNSNPNEFCVFRQLDWFRCSTGTIVARMVGRENYDSLVELYSNRMKRDNAGFYWKWYSALLQSLKTL